MRWFDADDLYYLTVVGLMRLLAWSRSPSLSNAVANTIARIAWTLPTEKRRHTLSRIAACLDPVTPSRRQEIAQRTYRTFWQDELALASMPARVDGRRTRVDGLEHLGRSVAEGHGAILLESSFFGRRNLARMLLHAEGIAIVQVHASDHLTGFWSDRDTKVRQEVIRPFLARCERRFVQEILYISRRDASLAFTRRLLRVLRDNRVLCLSAEGHIGRKAVALHFLGEERRFVTGAMSLAKHSGAPLLPLFCWRDDDDEIRLVIEPPLVVRGGARAAEAGVAAYAQLLEHYIRRNPSEYWGWHV